MNLPGKIRISSQPAIEFEVTNGDYEYNDGVYTVKSEALLRIKANNPGVKFVLHFVDDDGYETIYPILSVSEHECTGGNYFVASVPESGKNGLAVQLCTECYKPVDTRTIPDGFCAMLSDGQLFQNVWQAAEYAKENYEKVDLSLFGDITLDKELVIPDHVKLLITPFANITFKNSAHIVVGGEYIDFTEQYEASLRHQTDIIETTTASTSNTTTTTTTASTVSTAISTHIADDATICSWAIADYQKKTGKNNITAELNTDSDKEFKITLKESDGKILDVYTIDPASGTGTDSEHGTVNLPQTGNQSMSDWLLVFAAFLLFGFGMIPVQKSGLMRRRKK